MAHENQIALCLRGRNGDRIDRVKYHLETSDPSHFFGTSDLHYATFSAAVPSCPAAGRMAAQQISATPATIDAALAS